ncbi:hypothetical protein IV203_002763 [Nitzschia inconspicua]|uniref:RanBP2-type domain-containing protein n=1 Tax=Nitzschia inconspicua TaxID=303405 RepID=A0A9K3L0E8_9STRA|nr:hypothetical protein IV203_002763 [Nitzschia inconspicua]
MSTPPKQNGEGNTPVKSTPGFFAGLFAPFSSKKSQSVDHSTKSTSSDLPFQSPTSDTPTIDGISSGTNQEISNLNGAGRNTVSFAVGTTTTAEVGRATTTTTTTVVRDYISGTPFLPSRNGTSTGASSTPVDYTSPQEPATLTTAFNAAATASGNITNTRSPWMSPDSGDGFSMGFASPRNPASTRGRNNRKTPSSGLTLTPLPMRRKRSKFTPSLALSVNRRKRTGDMSNLSQLLSESADLFAVSKKRKQEEDSFREIVARRGTERRTFSRLATGFFKGDDDNQEEKDRDDPLVERSSKRQKKSVRFGTDGRGDHDEENHGGDNAALIIFGSTPQNHGLSKRKATPYKTAVFNDDDMDRTTTPPFPGRRKVKVKTSFTEPLKREFPVMPDLNLILAENQPFSIEQELEYLDGEGRVETGYFPPVSLIYPENIPDPIAGNYAGVTMQFFAEAPLPPKKQRQTNYEVDVENDSKRNRIVTPEWKCLTCGTMNPDDESKCKSCQKYKAADPSLIKAGWGDLFTESMAKRKCEFCSVLMEKGSKQCLACEAWICPECDTQNMTGTCTKCETPKSALFKNSSNSTSSGKPIDSALSAAGSIGESGFTFPAALTNSTTTSAVSGGFTFGQPTNGSGTTETAALAPSNGGGFVFPGPSAFAKSTTTSAPAPSTGFVFPTSGDSAPAPSTGFQFSTSAAKAPAPATNTGFRFSTPTTETPAFSFSAAPLSSSTSVASFGNTSAPVSAAASTTPAPAAQSTTSTPSQIPFGKSSASSSSDTGKPKFMMPSLNMPSTASSFSQTTETSTGQKSDEKKEHPAPSASSISNQQPFPSLVNKTSSTSGFSFGGSFANSSASVPAISVQPPTSAPSFGSISGSSDKEESQPKRRRARDDIEAKTDQSFAFGSSASGDTRASTEPSTFGHSSAGETSFGAPDQSIGNKNTSVSDNSNELSGSTSGAQQNDSSCTTRESGNPAPPLFGSSTDPANSSVLFSQAPAPPSHASLFGGPPSSDQVPSFSSGNVSFSATPAPVQAAPPSSGEMSAAPTLPSGGRLFGATPASSTFGSTSGPKQSDGPSSGTLFGSSKEGPVSNPSGTSFGSTTASSQVPSSSTNMFGSATGFGPSTSSVGAFGSAPAASGPSFGIGAPSAGSAPLFGSSFGSTTAPAPSHAFGSNTFGSESAAAPVVFGSTAAKAPASGGFGSAQAPPPAPFGQPSFAGQAAAPFGSAAAPPSAPSFNGFGSNPTFGDTMNPVPFGTNQQANVPNFGGPMGGGFGQQQPSAQPQQPMGGFGGGFNGAPLAGDGGAFSIGSGGTNTGSRTGPRRRIVKARRPKGPRPA